MKFLLDTCICVFLFRGKFDSLKAKIETFDDSDLVISSVTEAELRFGAEKSADTARHHERIDLLLTQIPVVDFGGEAARTYGKVRADLERRGCVIGGLDMMIAAHALSLGVPMVTNNVGEFVRVGGLEVEDWTR